MKSLGVISQLAVLGLAVLISILYTKPVLEGIQITQGQILEYQNQQAKIGKVNADLAKHVATIQSVSPQNITRLTTYVPKQVDGIAVMRDIKLIAESVGSSVTIIEHEAVAEQLADQLVVADDEVIQASREFTLAVDSTYNQLKLLLALLAKNNYPLEVHELRVQPLEGGFLDVTMQLVTYADSVVIDETN